MSIAEKIKEAAAKVSEVYEAGRSAKEDEFWDMYQDNGERTSYEFAFSGERWNDETFKPKYTIKIAAGTSAFYNSRITDLTNVSFDFSGATILTRIFAGCTELEKVGEIDLSGTSASLVYMFTEASKLKSIEKLIVCENNSYSFSFAGCTELENIIVEGTVGKNGLSFLNSTKLSKDSIISIISALSDTTSGYTVTLSSTAVSNAFEDSEWDELISAKSNWTVSLI